MKTTFEVPDIQLAIDWAQNWVNAPMYIEVYKSGNVNAAYAILEMAKKLGYIKEPPNEN